MKKVLGFIFTIVTCMSYATSNPTQYNICFNKNIVAANYTSYKVSESGTFNGIRLAHNNCLGIVINAAASDDVKNWVQNALASNKIAWNSGNMLNSLNDGESTPKQLRAALNVNAIFSDKNGSRYSCNNFYVAIGQDSYWIFSNNNSEKNILDCNDTSSPLIFSRSDISSGNNFDLNSAN